MPQIKRKPKIDSFRPAPYGEETGPCDYRIYLRSYGYSDDAITVHLEKIARDIEDRKAARSRAEAARVEADAERERLKALARAREEDEKEEEGITSGKARTEISVQKTATDKIATEKVVVPNKYGVPVERKGTKFTVFGVPTSRILQWCGYNGWTVSQALLLMERLGLSGVSGTSVGILVRTGAKGEDSKVFNAAELTKDQERKLKAVVKGGT